MNKLCLFISFSLLASEASFAHAQRLSDARTQPLRPLQECTYARCALRIEESNILAGADGRAVASLGVFKAAGLTALPFLTDSARAYFQQVQDNYTMAQALPILSGVLVGLGYRFALHGDPSLDRVLVGLGLSGGGLVAALVGQSKRKQVDLGLSRGVWWCNQQFAPR